MKKMAQKNKDRRGGVGGGGWGWGGGRRERKRERDRLVFLSHLCGMTSLCTAAVFVNQGQGCLLENFSGRKEGRRGEERKGKKQEREKEGRELRH